MQVLLEGVEVKDLVLNRLGAVDGELQDLLGSSLLAL
jgi:hypothetical protein